MYLHNALLLTCLLCLTTAEGILSGYLSSYSSFHSSISYHIHQVWHMCSFLVNCPTMLLFINLIEAKCKRNFIYRSQKKKNLISAETKSFCGKRETNKFWFWLNASDNLKRDVSLPLYRLITFLGSLHSSKK